MGTNYDAGVFSFYANKTITTAEGGLVVSKNKNLADRITSLRNHGITKPIWDRYTNNPVAYEYDIADLGYKYNLPDVLSAIGRAQLKKAVYFQNKRKVAADYYLQHLANIPYIKLPSTPKDTLSHSWHLFIIRITHPTISRDIFMQKLAQRGIGSSVHYKPLHLMTYYQKKFNLKPKDFPNALQTYSEVLSLPMYPEITKLELEEVSDTIIKIGNGEI